MDLLLQVGLSLAVIGALAATLALLRRKGVAVLSAPMWRRNGQHELIRVLSQVWVSPHVSLVLIQVGEYSELLAVGPTSCTVIRSITGAAESGPK